MSVEAHIYTEHNIECWVERQIDRLDCKYQLGQLSTADYHSMMGEINRQAEQFYAMSLTNEPYVYEL